jgi:WD40 repeat protein
VIDNLRDGFDIYRLDRTSPFLSLKLPAQRLYTKQASFAESMRLVVCGGDNGLVHIFDLATGKEIQTLKHGAGM